MSGIVVAMPREERLVIFDHAEAYKAIFALCVQKQLREPPPGSITGIEVRAAQSAMAFQIKNPQNGAAANCEYSCEFVTAALILYCRMCRIPLPKRGRKAVEIAGEDIILRVTVDTAERAAKPVVTS